MKCSPAIIAWNSVELLGRWHLFTEFWVHPQDFALEMSLIAAAVVVAAILVVRTPTHTKAQWSKPVENPQ